MPMLLLHLVMQTLLTGPGYYAGESAQHLTWQLLTMPALELSLILLALPACPSATQFQTTALGNRQQSLPPGGVSS